MVRIVRLSLEEGVSFPSEVGEIEWPEVALRRQREKPLNGPLGDPPPKRRRGRPRKTIPPPTAPQAEWPLGENPAPENPAPENSTRRSPTDADPGLA
jgi:hypothetical protein